MTAIERFDSLIELKAHLLENYSDSFFLIDHKLKLLYPDFFKSFSDRTLYIEGGEGCKTWEGLKKGIDFLLSKGVKRDSHLLAIGGGTISDLTGLMAGLVLRGVKWSVVPTTLLSMADAALGGKTAINHELGKNLIGSFHFPEKLMIHDSWTKTLNESETFSGLGEVVKTSFLDMAVSQGLTLQLDKNETRSDFSLVYSCLLYKKHIVEDDPTETKDKRILLNLGHTFGHGFEKALGTTHGHSVVMGLEFIARLFEKKAVLDRLESIYTLWPQLRPDWSLLAKTNDLEIWELVKKDKKAEGEKFMNIIIPEANTESFVHKIEMSRLKGLASKAFESLCP